MPTAGGWGHPPLRFFLGRQPYVVGAGVPTGPLHQPIAGAPRSSRPTAGPHQERKKAAPVGAALAVFQLLGVVDRVHVLDQLQNLVGVADLVVWAHPR